MHQTIRKCLFILESVDAAPRSLPCAGYLDVCKPASAAGVVSGEEAP